jgi:subtilisin family serine protease
MRPRPLLLALGLIISFVCPRHAEAGRVAPELQQVLQTAGEEERIPVLIILRDQADLNALRAETRGMPSWQRRAVAKRALRSLSAAAQGDVLRNLAEARARGRATKENPFWILNAVRAQATPDVLEHLASLPAVDRILWDPPVPLLQQIDDRPSGGDLLRPLNTSGITFAWQVEFVNAPDAWLQGFTGAGVLVAVVDTGVDYTHPDLANHIWVNADEIPDNEEDDDENGFVDDVIGWDFVQDDNDPMGTGSGDHGTKVAGLVVGDGTSGTLTGIAPEATVMPIRGAGGTWGDLIEGLQYAVDNGADIISMSVTQKWRFEPKPDFAAWRTIMDNELALGIIHVNSIGNEGEHLDTDPLPFNVSAPGNCPAPWVPGDQFLVGGVSGVIGAANVDSLEILANTSSRGPSAWEDFGANYPEYPYEMPPEYQDYPYTGGQFGLLKPDIAAPGRGTITTAFGGGYDEFNGTSASTPVVAAAAAIVLQANPILTPEEMTMILMTSARDVGPPGMDPGFGAGIVDVNAAVQQTLNWGSTSIIMGNVLDGSTMEPLPGALVTLLENGLQRRSRSDGSYVFVTPASPYTRTTDDFFYFADTSDVIPSPGLFEPPDVLLDRRPTASLAGQVSDADSSLPVMGARIWLRDTPVPVVTTDAGGDYIVGDLPSGREISVFATHFGHLPDSALILLAEGENQVSFSLDYGLRDDFELDQGWTVGAPGDDAIEGIWVREDPFATWFGPTMVQPEDDATPDPGVTAFFTGNNYPGADQNWNDVDNGRTTLLSPIFDASRFTRPSLEVRTWYSNDKGQVTDDVFTIEVSADSGQTWAIMETFAVPHREWSLSQLNLWDFVEITPHMRLRFLAEDIGGESSVEVAVDEILLVESSSSAGEPLAGIRGLELSASPNPGNPRTLLSLSIPRDGRARLDVVSVEGRLVRRLWDGPITAGLYRFPWDGRSESGRSVASGLYFAKLAHGGEARTERLLIIK